MINALKGAGRLHRPLDRAIFELGVDSGRSWTYIPSPYFGGDPWTPDWEENMSIANQHLIA